MLSVGGILEGAFGLVRRQPAAVAVWGLLYLAALLAMMVAMRPFTAAMVPMSNPDPQAAIAQMMATLRWVFLAELVLLVLFIILFNGAQRAVLRPEARGFFYLRVGMDELRMFGLTLLLLILFYAAAIVAVLAIGLLAGLAGVIGGAVLAGPIAILAVLALIGVIIWLEVRFSLAFPLTLLRGKIIIGESWRLTRGRFWTLFGAYLVVILVVMVVMGVAMSLNLGNYWGQLAQAGSDPERMRAVQMEMAQQMWRITPLNLLVWIVSSVAGALMLALWGGALATAALLATGGGEQPLVETFA